MLVSKMRIVVNHARRYVCPKVKDIGPFRLQVNEVNEKM